MDDDQLLRAYATDRSEAAFGELVRRHGALVHGVARRQAGIDAHLADDVTQRVFIALARKAGALRDPATLVGWLYQASRFEAARAVRAEARRRNREAKAGDMNESETPEAGPDISWSQLQPILDDAMAQLGEPERQAVLLRFFSGQSFVEVGRVFEISEDAARKRVERAIEKLRLALGRRGLVSTASALCGALGAHAAPAVSDEVLAAIAQGAWQKASLNSVFQFGLHMTSTKLTVAVAGVVILLAATSIVRDATLFGRGADQPAANRVDLTALARRRDDLRREVADVRRERAESDARERALIANTVNPVRSYLQDPEYRALSRTLSQARQHLEFQRFYRQRQLSPDQIARFETAMVRQNQASIDGQIARDLGRDEQAVYRQSGPVWASAMREILGDEGKKELEVYLRGNSIRSFVDSIAAISYQSGDPITLEQADRLIATALEHDPTYQSGKGTDPAKVSWNEVWEPAAKFLSPDQLVTFETAVEVWSLQKRISLARTAAPAR